MPNTQILPPLEGESEHTPKIFRNIDTEGFEFTWDGKPFGGALPERVRSWQEEVIDRDMMGKEIGKRIVWRHEILKPILSGEAVTLPKYLVNYAAMHLARKMVKREVYAGKTEAERSIGIVKFVQPEREMELQKLIVKDNFPPESTSATEMSPVHYVSHSGLGVKPGELKREYICDECGQKSPTPAGVVNHKRFRHKKEETQASESEITGVEEVKNQ